MLAKKRKSEIEGSIWLNHGRWYASVKLPGKTKRRNYPLKAPGAKHALAADRPRSMAEEALARLWEAAWKEANGAHWERRPDVEEAALAFAEWAKTYYKSGGEVGSCRTAMRYLRNLHGERVLGELTHSDMMRVRDAIIASGACRNTVNRLIHILTRRFSQWALDEGLITAAEKVEISQLATIKRGRTAAKETAPIVAARDCDIEAAAAVMVPHMATMLRVHRLTGMRPGELCAMKWEEIERGGDVWLYRPGAHKNDWRGELGQPRVVLIGPKAQALLDAMPGERSGHVFSPRAAMLEYMQEKREKRTSPFYPCRDESFSRACPDATRRPGEVWDVSAYNRSIKHAIARAGCGAFTSNQLRHSFATEVRRKFGLEACRAVLGHSLGGSVTDIYSFEAMEEEFIEKARSAVLALG